MNSLRSLRRWGRGFESHLRRRCLVCVCFILCLCCPVFRQRPCDELITRPRSPTVCEKWLRNRIRGLVTEWAGRAIEKRKKKKQKLDPPNSFCLILENFRPSVLRLFPQSIRKQRMSYCVCLSVTVAEILISNFLKTTGNFYSTCSIKNSTLLTFYCITLPNITHALHLCNVG
jgi:hypothetical protein